MVDNWGMNWPRNPPGFLSRQVWLSLTLRSCLTLRQLRANGRKLTIFWFLTWFTTCLSLQSNLSGKDTLGTGVCPAAGYLGDRVALLPKYRAGDKEEETMEKKDITRRAFLELPSQAGAWNSSSVLSCNMKCILLKAVNVNPYSGTGGDAGCSLGRIRAAMENTHITWHYFFYHYPQNHEYSERILVWENYQCEETIVACSCVNVLHASIFSS